LPPDLSRQGSPIKTYGKSIFGLKLIAHAQAGEEISDNYGPHFSMSTRSARRSWLQVETAGPTQHIIQ
jgi:hypothetical protein